jgi:hypothetical protein
MNHQLFATLVRAAVSSQPFAIKTLLTKKGDVGSFRLFGEQQSETVEMVAITVGTGTKETEIWNQFADLKNT